MNSPARQAPAVRFPVQRSRAVGGVLVAIVLAGLASLAAWWRQGLAAPGAVPVAVGAAIWLAAAAAAWHWWQGQLRGELHWDGQQWRFDSLLAGRPPLLLEGAPEVQWDLQGHLWVRVQGAAGQPGSWLWLERRWQPERWDDVRRAVYSRAGTGTAGAGAFAPHSRQA